MASTMVNDKRTLYVGAHAPATPARARLVERRAHARHLDMARCAGGLEESVTDDILRAAFLPFGEVTDVNLPLDTSSRARLPARRGRASAFACA